MPNHTTAGSARINAKERQVRRAKKKGVREGKTLNPSPAICELIGDE